MQLIEKMEISQKFKLFKKFKNYSPYNSDLIVVLGGDGFMLETLKKLRKFNKPFYGMNTWRLMVF